MTRLGAYTIVLCSFFVQDEIIESVYGTFLAGLRRLLFYSLELTA
jgi:hypothetical protein